MWQKKRTVNSPIDQIPRSLFVSEQQLLRQHRVQGKP